MTMLSPTTPTAPKALTALAPTDTFVRRHIGPSEPEIVDMLTAVGCSSLDDLSAQAIPSGIRMAQPLRIDDPTNALGVAERGEAETLAALHRIAQQNQVWQTWIGMGYVGTIVPGVIQRNILENPGWYTAYTPYQAEIAQGRLEALLNFQT
ncbi:MAG: glycine dehydrogenase, partial [Planctomycetota bacterium]